jgi:hypothetical protein
MAVVATNPTNFPRRINMYVPAMQYASDVNMYSKTRISFGAPSAAVSNNILNAQSVATAVTVDLSANVNAQNIFEPFGRTIQLVAGAANATVATVRGADYLGQPITCNVTLNGATAVETKKAFKYVDSVTLPLVAGGVVSVGWGTALGLPYKALRAEVEIANGLAVGTLGTFTAPQLSDPATATTSDPRGLYKPTTALNGANIISVVLDFVNDVNSNVNGGLHGIRQV